MPEGDNVGCFIKFHIIPQKHGNSAVNGKFCSLAQNSSAIRKLWAPIITFRVSRRRREMYIGRTCVCLSVRGCMTTLLHGPGCNLEERYGVPPSCALWGGGFAIGAWVLLLRQHSMNAKCQRVLVLSRCLVNTFTIRRL